MVFWDHEIDVGEQARFQILLSSQPNVSLSSIPFTQLAIHFSTQAPPLIIKHHQPDPDVDVPTVQRFDLGAVVVAPAPAEPAEIEAELQWGAGSTIVFTGSVSSALPMHISVRSSCRSAYDAADIHHQVSKLVFTIKVNSWWIEVPIVPETTRLENALVAPRWLCSVDPPRFIPIRREDHSSVWVRHRPHQVEVAISHEGPAYIGEEFPIEINITNQDDRELEVVLDVLLQPTEIDEAGGRPSFILTLAHQF